MSGVVLFEPHSDDGVLFAAFSLIRYRPTLITVLSSVKQDRLGVSQMVRAAETVAACVELGIADFRQWLYPDDGPDWDAVEAAMRVVDDIDQPEIVFAPAVEDGGHEQHSRVGEIASRVFGDRVLSYCTYVRGSLRTRTSSEVPFEPEWVAQKLRAMACYRSQIGLSSTLPWFIDDSIREYMA